MAVWAIGDLQGCHDELTRLIEKLRFDPAHDTLWFCGDLVNRGGQSLAVLRTVRALGERAIISLGNHDLSLLAIAERKREDQARVNPELREILFAPDRDELLGWLRQQKLLHVDRTLGHATSAADGSYVIEPYLPFPGSTFEVYTTADGYVESHKVFDATSPNAHVDVALIETATIAGTVRMPGGGTRANIPVSVAFQLGDGTWYQTFGSTQADGSFSVNALAPRSYRVCSGGIESGALQQCFDHLDHVSASGEPAFSAVTVGEGEERTGIDFDLDNGGSISGQLVDTHTSSPLAGYAADLQLYDAAGEFLGDQAFTTDAGGHYQVRGLPNGTFHVVLASSGPFIDDSQVYPAIACDPNCDPLLGDLVTIAASGDVAHIDFSFHPDALVHGKVVDAADGAGLDGVVVSAYVAVPTPMRRRTDAGTHGDAPSRVRTLR